MCFSAFILLVYQQVICISFGSKDERSYTIDQLMALYAKPPFIVFAIAFILGMLTGVGTVKCSQWVVLYLVGYLIFVVKSLFVSDMMFFVCY